MHTAVPYKSCGGSVRRLAAVPVSYSIVSPYKDMSATFFREYKVRRYRNGNVPDPIMNP